MKTSAPHSARLSLGLGKERADRPRLVNVHIGKSAGTWLRTNIQSHYLPEEICDFRFEHQFETESPEKYMGKRFFSAHVGHETASKIGGELITMLRNPFDRMLSLYYYWQEVEGAPKIARGITLKEFFTHKSPAMSQDIENAQAWQIAHGNTLPYRRKYSSISKDELLAKAIENLSTYAVVGVYEELGRFCIDLNNKFGFSLKPDASRVNVTSNRPRSELVTIEVRNLIYNRNDVDVALYEHVANNLAKAPAG